MPHLHSIVNGYVTAETAAKVNKALKAANVDAYINPHIDPGSSGAYAWFISPNYGNPQDRWTEKATVKALDEAGLWPVPVHKGLFAKRLDKDDDAECDECTEFASRLDFIPLAVAMIWRDPREEVIDTDQVSNICAYCLEYLEHDTEVYYPNKETNNE